MNIYVIYANSKQNNNKNENNFVILKEGFSWSAALFSIFWAIYHKMWLLVIAIIITTMIVNVVNIQWLMFISKFTIMLLFGFLATDIREMKLKYKNYQLRDIIIAKTEIEAELKFLERNC